MASKQAGAARVVWIALVAVVALGAGAWCWLHDDVEARTPDALRAPTADAQPTGALPAVPAAEPATPQQLVADVAPVVPDAQLALAAASVDDAPLVLDVRHAHGPPAAGGVVAVYTRYDALLAQGTLDAHGRWEHAGFDAPVEVYIAGCSADFGRLSLAVGRGAHELVLPEGGWVSGRVLVDGAAPDEPFALRLSGMTPTRELPDSASGIPRLALHHGGAEYDTTALTQPGGVFLVSGFPEGDKLRVGAAGEVYVRVNELSSPSPVELPHDGYVLALRRQPVIRGRVLHADGTPAAGDALQLEQVVSRAVPEGVDYQALGTTQGRGGTLDARGVFEVPITEALGACRCVDATTGSMLDAEACGPLELVVNVKATSAEGESAEAEQRVVRFDLDVDFGDLWMEAGGTHTLRVVDALGAPIPGARCALESRDETRAWLAAAALRSDEQGLVSFLASDADLGAVTVSAALHEPVRVELPQVPQPTPLDVVLPSATQLALHVRWPEWWSVDDIGVWYVELSGVAPLLRSEEGRSSTSGVPLAQVGASTPRSADGFERAVAKHAGKPGEAVALEFNASGDSISLDDLRADTPYRLRLHSRHPRAKLPPGPLGDITFWEREGVSLQRGEQRVLDVDLGALTMDPPGDDG